MGHQLSCSKMATLPGWIGQGPPWIECSLVAGMGAVPFGMALLHCIYHVEERAAKPYAKVPPLPPNCSSWGHSPEQPSVWGLLDSTDEEILEVAEDVHHGWYQVVLSILPCRHQDQLMGDLHNELGWWLWRAGLCGTTSSGRSQSRGRACSCDP